jgi:uncharacterized membrane-anchored protein YhcB (DUF1043 family)
MLGSVAANLLADIIWLPIGWLILRVGRRVLREIREEFAAQDAVLAVHTDLAETHRAETAALTDTVVALHERLDAATGDTP